MTDNNELYEVIGNILKEFKVEVEESIEEQRLVNNGFALDNAKHNVSTEDAIKELSETINSSNLKNEEHLKDISNTIAEHKEINEEKIDGALLATSDYVKGSDDSIDKIFSTLTDLTDTFELSDKESQEKYWSTLNLVKDAGKRADTFDENVRLYGDIITELRDKIKSVSDREADNTVASVLQHDDLEKTLKSLSIKNKDALEKHFADTVEAIETIKLEADNECKDKINAQYESLRKDYVELHNNLNKSFKNVPSNKDLVEFIATQDEITTSLREELAIQKQDNINLLAETKAYIDDIVPSLKGDTGSLERVIAWQKDYPREINQVVTHNNCLWQLKYQDSNESPGADSDDWRLLVAGLTDVTMSPDKEGRIKIVATDGGDNQYVNEIQLPIPNMLDTWNEDTEYKFYDNVKKDGCRWITHKDNPQGKPGESKDWHIDSLPAQRGRKGEKGDKGEIGSIGLNGHTPTKQEMITVMNEDR